MKIKSPLTDKKEVKLLCEAGANELFCGIEPYAWRVRFKDFCINQRSTGANFTKMKDLEEAISVAHKYRTKVHVAVNAFFYLEKQYKMAERIIKEVLNIGSDGIIFADSALVSRLKANGRESIDANRRKSNANIHGCLNEDISVNSRVICENSRLLKDKDVVIGTDAVIFNSAAVKFYKMLGATRLVFPRAMTVAEMKEVVECDRSVEYEVFIIHDLCFFEDGFCTYCKEQTGGVKKEGRGKRKVYFFTASRIPARGFGGGCRTPFKRQRISLKDNKQIGTIKPFSFWGKKHIQGCGACAIYDLRHIDVTSLKVLDRNLPTEEKVKATLFIKKCLDLLNDNNISKPDYIDKCKDLFKKTFKVRCSQYDCYYPDANTRESNANTRKFK